MKIDECDYFTRSYIEALLWSSHDDEVPEWDALPPSPELIERAHHECRAFLYRAQWMIDAEPDPPDSCGDVMEQAGHDFALTRNDHGAGFWDGDWPTYGDRLTKVAKSFGEVNVYLGDDGLLHTE